MPAKRFTCEYPGCCKSYCSSFNLNRHKELIHLGVRKFKCSFCGRFLSSKQNLIDHQHIHTGLKPYSCDVAGCGQAFRQLSQFYIHRQLHSEINSQIYSANYISNATLNMLTSKLRVVFKSEEEGADILNKEISVLPKIEDKKREEKLPLFEEIKFRSLSYS